MQSKGTLGSIIAGVIAVFLTLICLFYLSFTIVNSKYEKKASEYATELTGTDDANNHDFDLQRKHYLDSVGKEKVWLGYNLNEVRRWSIGLGLDLKGGMSVILQVNMSDLLTSLKNEDVNEVEFNQALNATREAVKNNPDADFVKVFFDEYQQINQGANFSRMFKVNVEEGASNAQVINAIKAEVKDMVETSAVHVLRNRIDAFGVVSPNIQVLQGRDAQILVELPGVKDHERMEKLLKQQAKLEFYETYRTEFSNVANRIAAYDKAQDPENRISAYAYELNFDRNGDITDVVKSPRIAYNNILGYFSENDTAAVSSLVKAAIASQQLPEDIRILRSHKGDEFEGKDYFSYYILHTDRDGNPAMDGSHVTTARSDFDEHKGVYVDMEMDGEGAQLWGEITGRNLKYPVAIALDGEVYSAPTVQSKITGGTSQITGNFNQQEGRDLANVLKSGKMSAGVDIISSEVIGPSLGEQAIRSGITSFIVALVLLMIFMCAYYGIIPGLVANGGLILNIFFTFGILSSFQAVLTMSGIAGIVLALGMAVDANVLIFERAKEELRAGKNARTAISEGYSNAFSAIFDSNLTSIITGVILLLFGTGPIKGFATTLIIGICCSFFTAVYLTRIVFILGAKKKCFENLTFTTRISKNLFKSSNFNFLGKRKLSFIIVGATVVIVVASFFVRGLNQGIDFSGGRNYIVKLDNKDVTPAEIQEALRPQFENSTVQVINIEGKDQVRVSTNWRINDNTENVDSLISRKLFEVMNPMLEKKCDTFEDFSTKNSEIGIVSSQKVGATVANDMRKAAIIAVALALVAMFLYILLRFRNVAFSLGALAAVSFTAFTIIGFYSIFWGFLPFAMEIDQTFIAAILTVIGYQINDTVVVFDRVRENTALYPKKNFFDIINSSINSTLGRTIMTSGSTLLVLLSIFFLGGDAIRSFTFAMIFGVIIGTLSTIFIASPVAYITDSRRKKKGAKETAAVANA